MATKLLLVDDHALFRRGLMALLNSDKRFEIVGEAANGTEAIEKTRVLKPDLVLMDLDMPGTSGVEATRSIRESGFNGKVLILTIADGRDDIMAAVKAGANGYILKGSEPEELTSAIDQVMRGGSTFSAGVASTLFDELRSSSASAVRKESENGLSPREKRSA